MFGVDRNVSAGQFNQSSNISRRETDTDVWKLMAKMGGRASHLARQYRVALLFLSYHGGIRDGFHRHHGIGSSASFSQASGINSLDAVGLDARISVSLHREHRGLDDGRIGPPAVACLRTLPHATRDEQRGQPGQRGFHPDRFLRPLLCPRSPVCISRWARDFSWSGGCP